MINKYIYIMIYIYIDILFVCLYKEGEITVSVFVVMPFKVSSRKVSHYGSGAAPQRPS